MELEVSSTKLANFVNDINWIYNNFANGLLKNVIIFFALLALLSVALRLILNVIKPRH